MISDQTDTGLDDPSLAAADKAEDDELRSQVEPVRDDSAAALIRKFEAENRLPDVDKGVLENMDEERKYVHTEANLATTVGGVSTNYLYKFQRVHKAQINARNPQVSVRPKKRIGQVDPIAQQMMTDFSATMQALITHFFSADEMNIKAVLDGAIQDIDTVGIVFLKLDWLEDMQRDPVGAWRPADFQGTLAKMKVLLGKKQRGECVEGDAEYEEMKNLADTIRRQMEGEFWKQVAFSGSLPGQQDPRKTRWDGDGLPSEAQLVELPKFRGFVLRSIMPEDTRRDWSIFRPEEFSRSRQFTYCLRMTPDEIREFFGMDRDASLLPFTMSSNNPDGTKPQQDASYDPADRSTPEPQNIKGELIVWIRMDSARNKVYSWIQGGQNWLRPPETPEVSTSNWYNVWPVLFNRVTGRFLPLSNTTLGKPLQEEINIVRTHKRAAKRRAYDAWIYEKNLFTDDEAEKLRNRAPGSWTPTSKTREELDKGIYQMKGQYDPMVHDVMEERQELGSVLNQSQASQGMTRGGADSATEAAIATQTGDAITADDQGTLEATIRSIAVAMGETLVQALPEDNAKAIAGPGAFWPNVPREQIWAHLLVEIEAGSTGMPNMQKRLDGLKAVVDIAAAAGIGTIPGGPRLNPIALMKKVAEILDWRDDPEALVDMPMPLMAPQVAAAAGMGGGGAPSAAMPPEGMPPGQEMQQEQIAPPTLPLVESQPMPPGVIQ